MNITIIILVLWVMGLVSGTEFIKRLPDWAWFALAMGVWVLAMSIDGGGL